MNLIKKKEIIYTSEKQINYELILLKYVMSIMVIGLHTFRESEITYFWEFLVFQVLGRPAVPCFFVISAYFYFLRGKNTREALKKYCNRMGMLIVLWALVLFPYIAYYYFYIPIKDSPDKIRTVLQLFSKNLLCLPVNGFWYIYASMICAVLLWKLQIQKRFRVLFLLGCFFQLICILSTNYYYLLNRQAADIIDFIEENIFIFSNSFFPAIIYFCMGYYIASSEITKVWAYRKRKLGLAVSLTFLILEVFGVYIKLLYKTNDCYFMLIPVTYFLIINMFGEKIHLKRFGKFISAVTTVQYITQFACLFLLQCIAIKAGIYNVPPVLKFLSAVIGGHIITCILLKLETYTNFWFIRKMY